MTGDPRQATTALARRHPEALRRAPDFYPEGHADADLAIVVFGAPIASAAGVGVLLAMVGSGAAGIILGAALAVPVASVVAHNRLSHRGKQALASARNLYAHDLDRGLAALEAVAQSGALPEVRLEAAADVAAHRIERGDIRGAVDALSIHEQDAGKLRRRRNWEVGLRGEALRSILAWLSPSSFAESGVAASDAFEERSIDDDGRALLAALRVLESAAASDEGALANAWRDARGTLLSERFPTLDTIALAVAAERVHHLLDTLHERLEGERGEYYREVLRQLFPRMQLLDASGYREAGLEDPVAMTQALAVDAPKQVVALARQDDLAPPGSEAPQAFATTYGTLIAASALIGAAAGSAGVGAFIGFVTSLYFGTPFAAIWGSRRTQRKRQAHRVAPLVALEPRPPKSWLIECACGPPGPVTRTTGYRRLLRIPESTMVLYVCVARAEDALRRLERSEAWDSISWWYDGFSGRLQHDDAMYAAGGALVRIAALTGHLAEARRLMAVLPERGNAWDDPTNRSSWGNAPRATRLVDALVLALEGEWELARLRLEWAMESNPVFLTERDRALYERLAYAASKAGVDIRWPVPTRDPKAKIWASAVWPKT